MKNSHTSASCFPRVPLCLILSGIAAQAAPLFSEGFDNDQAKVAVMQRSASGSALEFVDYSNFERVAPTAAGPTRVRIPEAPNRIAGTVATRGVVLSALYNVSERSIMLLAADAAAGTPVTFSGNYRVTFDMWLSVDPASTAGTTEGGLWTVNSPGGSPAARLYRSSSRGNWGWLTTEGGSAAGTGVPGTTGSGDAVFYNEGVQTPYLDGPGSAPFPLAFPQGSSVLNTPNNQWTSVEVTVRGAHVDVKFNGVLFFERETILTEGFAGLGYDDLYSALNPPTGSASGSPNLQFGLFDNFVVESVTDTAPLLTAAPQTVFTAAVDNSPVAGDFAVTNSGLTDLRVLSATVDGPDASQFSIAPGQTFPMVIPGGQPGTVAVNFNSAIPNGLKVARLVLTTNDPNAPTITVPLQARRKVLTVEGPALTAVPSVSVQNGSSTRQITVTNSSGADVSLTAVTVTGANPGDFTVTTPLPLTVAPGESAVLDVKFAPTGSIGVHSASVDVTTTDPNLPILSLPVKGRYAYGPPLLAQYKLDETEGTAFVDSTGTSPNASVQIREQPPGFGQPSLLPNGEGTAFHFTPAETNTTGNLAYALVPHLPNVSYSLWIKPEAKAATTNRTILHRSSLFTTLGTLYSLNLSPTGQLLFDINKLSSGGASTVQTEDGAIVDGQIYHVVVTHTDENGFSDGNEPIGTRTRLFINGSKVSEVFPDSPGYTDYQLTSTSEGLYIASATSSGAGYQGDLDDLQIYSVELTPEQVAGMYQQPGKTAFNLENVTVPFDITGIVYNATAGTITISWSSQTGAVYQVLQSSTLSGFTPVPTLTNIPSAGATTTAVITGVTPGGKNFYRIGRVSP
ncbi:MAG: LamG-like jellyroll fold domain-containing protein [Verrucomicrobiota bacterium]